MTTFETSRQFSASPAAVFAAIQDPTRLAKWWGPAGFTNEFEVCEFKPGGQWRFKMIGPDGTVYPNESEFSAIEPDHKVVIRHVVQPHFELTLTLEANPLGTLLHWSQAFDDDAVAQAVKHICEPANEQNLDRLAAELGPQTGFRFNDGGAYERYMGKWSQLVGHAFLDWLAPRSGMDWLDVGCGNGAFTQLIAERCAPRKVFGIDPSEDQLKFAKSRLTGPLAEFTQGDAMALPFEHDQYDAAVMPLVIFFVPQPAQGVAEMARVVKPGGIVTAYGWDLMGGGFPYESMQAALRDMGLTVPLPPSPDAANIDNLDRLWREAGLSQVETRVITVQRTYANFDDYWTTVQGSPMASATLALMSSAQKAALQDQLRERLGATSDGPVTCSGFANAVKGVV
ncbi:MAG: methyltransferase domain-containing protein [Burkholderiales bacterium]|nr:methyltransferase domain-containing protein [Burkholderiales bacterium]